MRILNKTQFAKMPAGTVYCQFEPCVMIGGLYVKNDYYIYDNKPNFNGVINICPYFDTDNNGYNDIPSETTFYKTECFSTDTSLCDFEDTDLFAVFSKEEVRRMIDVFTYALCDCQGKCFTDDDLAISE